MYSWCFHKNMLFLFIVRTLCFNVLVWSCTCDYGMGKWHYYSRNVQSPGCQTIIIWVCMCGISMGTRLEFLHCTLACTSCKFVDMFVEILAHEGNMLWCVGKYTWYGRGSLLHQHVDRCRSNEQFQITQQGWIQTRDISALNWPSSAEETKDEGESTNKYQVATLNCRRPGKLLLS